MSWDKDSAKIYLEKKTVLVVKQNLQAARAFRKMLRDFHFVGDLVTVAADIYEAQKLLKEIKPDILVVEQSIGRDSGLELVKLHNELRPNRLEASSLLISTETTDLNLGTIAELQVDAILFKPYTLQTLEDCLVSAFAAKFSPSAFMEELEKAKEEMRAERFAEAVVQFESALKLNTEHAPLYAYYAEVKMKLQQFEEAESLARKGLAVDPNSFLSINILFEIFLAQKKYNEAYPIAEQIHTKYPPSANRLLDLVKLSIYCAKFEDIQVYCNHFKALDATEPELNRMIIAALLIASKYFRSKGQRDLSKEVLKDAARIATKAELLHSEVLRYLIENKDLDDADAFFLQMSDGLKQRADILVLRMELLFLFEDFNALMQLGQKMIQGKLDTKRVYDLMIECSHRLNRSEQNIKDLISESQMRHPEDSAGL